MAGAIRPYRLNSDGVRGENRRHLGLEPEDGWMILLEDAEDQHAVRSGQAMFVVLSMSVAMSETMVVYASGQQPGGGYIYCQPKHGNWNSLAKVDRNRRDQTA